MHQQPPTARPDPDPQELVEWLESIESVVESGGEQRARELLVEVARHAEHLRLGLPNLGPRPYVNTIAAEAEPQYPGDEELERRLRALVRWNAMAMVVRANKNFDGIGGHLASYASAAHLYEVGFNHFFRGKDGEGSGDQIFYQGHSSPGIYARSYLEGRFDESQLDHFRREVKPGAGLSSYPHPRLMPEYWEYPTVSMGLGPINAVYQARFNRYLENRGFPQSANSRVWCFLGDGECDEPESLGCLSIAAREQLDNLVFVVNCNLQRLDGPVRGNGKIIQELESIFRGAGWNVLKVVWGREWDGILDNDDEFLLTQRLNQLLDGHWQRFSVESGSYIRQQLIGEDPHLGAVLEGVSDQQLKIAKRGGHDVRKVYAAYQAAVEHRGQPTVVLAKTVKGYALGNIEASNVTHQVKKMELDQIKAYRDRLQVPLTDSEVEKIPFYRPEPNSPEIQYLHERRRQLGGYLPSRKVQVTVPKVPGDKSYAPFKEPTRGGVEVSTTVAFVRLMRELLRHAELGKRIVPIICDEARTFGMESFFKQIGIYSAVGQLYEPADKDMLLGYAERKDGQILEEGLTEAGSMGSFIAAATNYSNHGELMLPFYLFYSMFGFQRVGDSIWALGDARGRGFLLGCTAGRTTLNGEGLQHEDGHSLLVASTVPNCVAYDPAYAYEVAAIVRDGLRRMVTEQEDVFYYMTLYNENIEMPALPEGLSDAEICSGIYSLGTISPKKKGRGVVKARLLGSGPMLPYVRRAAETLAQEYGVQVEVLSVTSYTELRKQALQLERQSLLHPAREAPIPRVTEALPKGRGPVIAVSDFMRAVPDQISRWVPDGLTPLGTDGFGMSDTREALRRYFEIDEAAIIVTTLSVLCRSGKVEAKVVEQAMTKLGVDPEQPFSLNR